MKLQFLSSILAINSNPTAIFYRIGRLVLFLQKAEQEGIPSDEQAGGLKSLFRFLSLPLEIVFCPLFSPLDLSFQKFALSHVFPKEVY